MRARVMAARVSAYREISFALPAQYKVDDVIGLSAGLRLKFESRLSSN